MVSILVASAALIAATPAAATERVTDGSFEAGSSGPAWTPSGVVFRCNGGSVCGSSAHTGTWYAYWFGSTTGAITQPVTIVGPPATLSFWMGFANPTGTVTATLDGAPVTAVSADGTPGYRQTSVDVSSFADGGQHLLSFSGIASAATLDDVSLTSGDTPQPPPPDPVPPVAPLGPVCHGKASTITGTEAAEILQGTSGADVISALDGDDVVRAGGGNDLICGGDGDDEINGGGGKDKLYGDDGTDKLKGAGGKDTCVGGDDRDKAAASCEKRKQI